MSLCRVTGLLNGNRYRAKSTLGVWRTLSEGDTLATGETIEVFSGGPKFGETVCTIEERVSGAWSSAIVVQLDLTLGSSHTVKQLLTITGDATDSTVTALVTGKGHWSLRSAHNAQVNTENILGVVFEWNNGLWLGVHSAITREKDAGKGGFMEGADAVLVANRSQFAKSGALPISGNRVSIASEWYEIIETEVGDVSLSFELRRSNRA